MRLDELQRQFQQSVLERGRLIVPALVGAGAADFDARLGAYVEGYRSRLVEALASTYPALKATLGEAGFDERMREYIEANPSRHYSVRYYGAGVADFMATHGDAAARAALADLGRWEWLLAEVFDAPDDASIGIGALGGIAPQAWGHVSFQFRACVRRIGIASNAIEYWRASKDECAPPASFEASAPSQWLLWRRGTATLFRSVDPLEAMALDGARAGASFGVICERLAARLAPGEVALRAASLLRGWVEEELIAGLTPGDAAP